MKPRPALPMNRDETAGDPDELFVVLLTTIGGLPGEVKLDASDGMPRACALMGRSDRRGRQAPPGRPRHCAR